MRPTVHDHGFTVVCPQTDEAHLVDVVIIHGLQGHPLNTWLYKTPHGSNTQPKDKASRLSIARLFGRKRATFHELVGEPTTAESTHSLDSTNKTDIYWPTDLLPAECPQARIMVWGYDTMVTRGPGQAANKSGMFTHGQNLLYSLNRQRDYRKPIIFVAHSLGGILVKEMISYAEASKEDEFLEIVQDISAVVFLGTPHRGSDAARVGDIARRVASALRIDTNPAILDSLGLRNDDLVRSQQSFARIWDERRFGVKTFQESKGVSGVNVGMLNDLIVPIESSTLGHPREHPESLDADHLGMCKFTSCDDPNYRKFGAEMKKLYKRATEVGRGGDIQPPLHDQREALVEPAPAPLDLLFDKARLSLAYRNMGLRERIIERPASGTCNWPLAHPEYQAWLTRSNLGEHRGLLRLIGHPGSGKSVLVKALAAACTTHTGCPEDHVATFFFDARGDSDQKSRLGFLKALLFQLLPLCSQTFASFKAVFDLEANRRGDKSAVEWNVGELRDTLFEFCSVRRETPIYIFVDATDECEAIQGDLTNARTIAIFLQDLADTAYNAKSNINICMSGRRYPAVSIRECAEIYVDEQNSRDLERFVSRGLDQFGLESSAKSAMKLNITSRAGGVFLWARLVLSSVAQSFDAGLNMGLSSVFQYQQEAPEPLYRMFDRILEKLSPRAQSKALRLFQWAVLAQRPLSAKEWIHVLAFVDEPNLRAMRTWNESIRGVGNMEQLSKRLRDMTGGLLELKMQHTSQGYIRDGLASSTRSLSIASMGSAVAGSMEPSGDGSPVVQFIHLSAYQYFLTGEGFELLGEAAPPDCLGAGHVYIAATCLRYTQLDEVTPLLLSSFSPAERVSLFIENQRVAGGERMSSAEDYSSSVGDLSLASFGSSAASSSRRSSLQLPEIPTIPAVVDETSIRNRSQLMSGWLETLHRERGSIPHVPQSVAAYPEHPLGLDLQSRHVRSEKTCSPPLSESPDDLPARETHYLLTEDPVLRIFAIEMFVHHAFAADELSADPSELLDVVEKNRDSDVHNGCWHRWCELKDGMWSDTTPTHFAAKWNLKTWIRWYFIAPSYRKMLNERVRDTRYPLLAAILRGNKSLVSCLSSHIDADVTEKDAWALLHNLATASVKGDATLDRPHSNYDLIEELLNLFAGKGDEILLSRFRSFMSQIGFDVPAFESMLARIQASSSTGELSSDAEPQSENTAKSLLNDFFLKAIS